MQEQMTQAGGLNYISHQNDGDNLSQQYESVFTDMAYQAFNTRFPDMAPMVTTFQVIVSNIDEGSAVGAFLLDISGEMYHVPVVMADNKIKPMDMIYSKGMDKFFPFTPEWVSTIQSMSTNEEGDVEGLKERGVQSPRDVTQTLQPPQAAYQGGLGLSPTGMTQIAGMTTIASDGEDYKEVPKFTELLKVASNETKEKFIEMLKSHEGIFKFAAAELDLDTLQESLQATMDKTASETDVENDELRVLDIETPVEQLKKSFSGKGAVKAMEDIARRGFTPKDTRKKLNVVYDIETPMVISEIEKPGFYDISKRDGSMETALILMNLVPKHGPYISNEPSLAHADECTVAKRTKTEKLVIFPDGSFFKTDSKIAAKPVLPVAETKKSFDKLLKTSNPKKKDAVTFIKAVKDTFAAVEPFYIDKVVMEASGTTRYCELDPYYYEETSSSNKSMHSSDIGEYSRGGRSQVSILHSLPTAAKPFYSEDRNTLFLEKGFTPIILGETADAQQYLLDPASILLHLKNRAQEAGSTDLKISSRGGDDYSVDGKPSGTMKETVEKVANAFHVDFETIYEKVANLVSRGDKTKLMVVPFEKDASIFMGTPGTQVSPEMVQDQAMEQQQPQMPMQQEMPVQPQSYMDPSLMQAGAGMQNEEIYNLGAIQSIVEDPKVMEMMQEYTPALEKAMDHSARLLLTLWTEGGQHLEDLGEERYKELESSARNAFKELGKLLLLVTKHPGEIA